MRKTVLMIALSTLIVFMAACGRTADSEKTTAASAVSGPITLKQTDAQRNYQTLEEVISESNTAFVGKFLDSEELEYMTRYRFAVQEDLYGNIEEKEVFLSIYRGSVSFIDPEDGGKKLPTGGENAFRSGKNYLLVTVRYKSIFYDHDQYLLTMPYLFNETDQDYTYAGKKYTGETGEALHEKVRKLHAASKETIDEGRKDGTWEDAPFIGEVEALKKCSGGTKGYSAAQFEVKLISLSKGAKEDLSLDENGVFTLCVDESLMEEGGVYEVAFYRNTGGVICQQNGKDTVRKIHK